MGRSEAESDLLHLPLAGLAVGNGMTDPEEQYRWYAEMAFNNSHDIKIIDEDIYNIMKKREPKCEFEIHKCNHGTSEEQGVACSYARFYCGANLEGPPLAGGINPYDISKQCGPHPLCYDFTRLDTFMNAQSTKEALHVAGRVPAEWQTCNDEVNQKFDADAMKDFSPFVADLLDDGIPVLVYAGDLDFVCNYLGNRAWTLGLDWSGHDDFNEAEEHDWNDGAGLARTARGLTFLQVHDAGHMVPTDQPEAALTLVSQFLKGEAI